MEANGKTGWIDDEDLPTLGSFGEAGEDDRRMMYPFGGMDPQQRNKAHFTGGFLMGNP